MRFAFVLLLLALPALAQVNPTGQHGVDLQATSASSGVPATGFNVYRATVTGGCSTVTATGCTKLTTTAVTPPVPPTPVKYTDGCPANPGTCQSPALTEGTTFFYVWTAINGAATPIAESAPSAEVKASIPFQNPVPSTPGTPQVTAVR